MATFVLVHGGGHGGWCWKKLLPLLRASGHDVYTPTLTGLGERSHLLARSINLSCHIQDVVNVLAYEDLTNVILVGHSYAGLVITGVADKAAHRLSQLVYLDAFVPKNGESGFDQLASTSTTRAEATERLATGDWQVLPEPPENYGVTELADCKWLSERVGAHPLGTMIEPLDLPNGAADLLTRTFISCTVDQDKYMPSVVKAAARVRSETGWRYVELATGHDAMITAPIELVQILLSLV